MGERRIGKQRFTPKVLVTAVEAAVVEQAIESQEHRIKTAGGRFQVRWDENGTASALGQLAFFAEFLEESGLFERWVQSCPLFYTSPNAPGVQDILGTWLLSILDGQWRYAHISGLRGDSVSPQILGMKRILSDESLRRALMHLAPCPEQARTDAERARREAQLARSEQWMDQALRESLGEALRVAWILDCDTTIKVLYGHQAGAVLGYNPQKPGRPSHSIHTYWIANVRLALDAEVQPGNTTAAKYSLPRLIDLLHSLPPEQRPQLVRGDNAFGNEPVMSALEDMAQPYLFKLRHPKTRLEAITSRPLLLSGVARLTQHARESRLLLTLVHEAKDEIKAMIANVRKGLDSIRATAPQLPKAALARRIDGNCLAA